MKVPVIRQVAKEFKALPLADVEHLLHSKIHEDRTLALVILGGQFTKGDDATRRRIYDIYLASTKHINNWDLVDLSAPQVIGGYLEKRSRKPLYRLAKSASLRERRIAILATSHFIRQGDFADTLRIAEKLLGDQEDLIHKAVDTSISPAQTVSTWSENTVLPVFLVRLCSRRLVPIVADALPAGGVACTELASWASDAEGGTTPAPLPIATEASANAPLRLSAECTANLETWRDILAGT